MTIQRSLDDLQAETWDDIMPRLATLVDKSSVGEINFLGLSVLQAFNEWESEWVVPCGEKPDYIHGVFNFPAPEIHGLAFSLLKDRTGQFYWSFGKNWSRFTGAEKYKAMVGYAMDPNWNEFLEDMDLNGFDIRGEGSFQDWLHDMFLVHRVCVKFLVHPQRKRLSSLFRLVIL